MARTEKSESMTLSKYGDTLGNERTKNFNDHVTAVTFLFYTHQLFPWCHSTKCVQCLCVCVCVWGGTNIQTNMSCVHTFGPSTVTERRERKEQKGLDIESRLARCRWWFNSVDVLPPNLSHGFHFFNFQLLSYSWCSNVHSRVLPFQDPSWNLRDKRQAKPKIGQRGFSISPSSPPRSLFVNLPVIQLSD